MDSLTDKKLVVDKIRNFVFNEIPHAKWGEDLPQRILVYRTLVAFPFRRHEGSVKLKFTNYKDKENNECLERFVLKIDETEIRLSYSDENDYDNSCYHLGGDHDEYKDKDFEQWLMEAKIGLDKGELEFEIEDGLIEISEKTGYESLFDDYEDEGFEKPEYDKDYYESEHDDDDDIDDEFEDDDDDDDECRIFKKDGKVGLARNREIIIQSVYQDIKQTEKEDIFWVKDKFKWQILDVTNGKVIETEFEEVEYIKPLKYATDKYYVGHEEEDLKTLEDIYQVKINGKTGIANLSGKIILPLVYDELRTERFSIENNGVQFDWIYGKVNDYKYVFGNLLLNSGSGDYEVTGNSLQFCKRTHGGYITLGHGLNITLILNRIGKEGESRLVESFRSQSTGAIKKVSDLIRHQQISIEKHSSRITFDFWYLEKGIEDVYIDASYKIEKL